MGDGGWVLLVYKAKKEKVWKLGIESVSGNQWREAGPHCIYRTVVLFEAERSKTRTLFSCLVLLVID